MARDDAPPFARGETYYNGTTKESFFADPLNYLGKEYVFEPNSPDGQATGDKYGRPVRVRVVQNGSGAALLPKKLAHYTAGDPMDCIVDGYTFAVGDRPAGVIDDLLPAAGVPNGDLFYIIIDGPANCLTVSSGLTTLAASDAVVPGTGTSILHADAGRIQKQSLAGATTTLGANILNQVGFSEQANSTGDSTNKVVVRRIGK